jgi:hypothetical protein
LPLVYALVMDIYGEYGMKFEEATTELNSRLTDPATPEGQKARAPDDAASMAMLQAMMRDSNFGGPKG